MNLFRRPFEKTYVAAPAAAAAPVDVRDANARAAADARAAKIEARRSRQLERERVVAERRAYAKGRHDEHARHRSHPILMLLLLLAAGAAAFVVYLAFREGSFTGAGQVLDQHVTAAAQSGSQTGQGVANRAGSALENAGARLKQTAGTGN